MPDVLVLDETAMSILGRAILDDEWFTDFLLPHGLDHLKRVAIKNVLYLLSDKAAEESNIVVARIGAKGIFANAPNPRNTLDRLIHISLAQFEKCVSIPLNWKPFNDGSRLSVYAQPGAQGAGQRLYVERNPCNTRHIYAYALTYDVEDFDAVDLDESLFYAALDTYVDAILTDPPLQASQESYGIELTETLGITLLGRSSLTDWYEKRLTEKQREFVDRDHSAPVRLKGSAGTGKTLSLAIKCLRDTYQFETRKQPNNVAFITHSSSLAHDVVLGMFYALDPDERWKNLTHCHIWLGSLYELAQEFLRYNQKDLRPISTDGLEGREFQFTLIDDAVNRCLANTRFAIRHLTNCNVEFANMVRKPESRPNFIRELANEFACVVEAERIRKGNSAAEKYLSEKRDLWQMELPSEKERTVVLEIYEEYARELETSNVLSMDQMIADFNRYLDTHEWRRLRERSGFDVVFVDELHYFNKSERMIFHNIFKGKIATEGKYPLFLAYDLKQSPTDAFSAYAFRETASNLFKSIGAGETDLVELTESFRCTPQISRFLKDLDGSFLALGLGEEWGDYEAIPKTENGDVPTLKVYDSNKGLLDKIFAEAQVLARRYGGRQVAVLCVNDTLFATYLNAGRIRDKFIPISGRDEIGQLKYAGKRCVFSMPEFVAGLQFQAVFLIHVDKVEIDGEDIGIGEKRRFISRCYLGASRASVILRIASSDERGGPSRILDSPIESGSIVCI